MSVTAAALDTTLSDQAASSYAGLNVDPHHQLVFIHVVETKVGGRRFVANLVAQTLRKYRKGSVLPLTAVHYVPAKVAEAQLLRDADLLDQAETSLRARGITLEYWGPDIMHNTFDVGVYNAKARGAHSTSEPRNVVEAIESIVGSVNIQVHGVGSVQPAYRSPVSTLPRATSQ